MLYYSGFTRRLGEVDEGSTVMDYLPAERARGITITSAAITFSWTPPDGQMHTINLIDTPGHADFTFEVERAIRVLDGAVTVLDGVAGVEAQTETVWRQAAKHRIPRIVFVNKLDRVGARFGATVRDIAAKLNAWPAVLQLPLYEKRAESSRNDARGGEDVLRGIVDLVEKRVFLYEEGGDGRNIAVRDYVWLHEHHAALHAEALAAHEALVELLGEHDDHLVELFLELGEPSLIPAAALKASLRKLTLPGSALIVPVLCGASFRNVGVQPLLDAVVDYLPSPVDRPPVDVTFGGSGGGVAPLEHSVLEVDTGRTCALAFKVVNDAKRGAMVFVRVYSGSLSRAQTLYNTSLRVKERAHRLLRMYADEAVDIDAIPTGHIGVILGLKQARTGDTLVSEHPSPSLSSSHKSSPSVGGKAKKKQHSVAKYDPKTLRLRPIDVPPPVFFASLEPYSLAEQKNVEEALAMLLREDPSLSVSTDPDSGQLLLSGMGELHLEIGRDRLVHDLKAKADMGRILIAYRETVSGPAGPERHLVGREIAAKAVRAACTASVRPSTDSDHPTATHRAIVSSEGNAIEPIVAETHISDAGETVASKLPAHLTAADISAAMVSGAAAALARGPHLGFPLRHVHTTVSLDPATDLFLTGSTTGAISSAARHAVAAALRAAQASSPGQIVEPVMSVTVSCDEKDLGKVVADISSNRGGHVLSLGDDGDDEARAGAQAGEIEMERVFVPAIGAEGRRSGGGREAGEGRKRAVHARVPLGEMVGYLKHLRGMTKGSGTFVMALDGWQRMQGPRAREVERGLRGE